MAVALYPQLQHCSSALSIEQVRPRSPSPQQPTAKPSTSVLSTMRKVSTMWYTGPIPAHCLREVRFLQRRLQPRDRYSQQMAVEEGVRWRNMGNVVDQVTRAVLSVLLARSARILTTGTPSVFKVA